MSLTATGTRHVLVVDDDADIRLLVTELLRLSGYEPLAAASGVEALDTLCDPDATLPSLVLLDVQMPVLDGWATLRELRATKELENLPVVLCTVKATSEAVLQGWRIGCDGYLAKPFAISDLLTMVEQVLARTPAQRRSHRRMQEELALRLL